METKTPRHPIAHAFKRDQAAPAPTTFQTPASIAAPYRTGKQDGWVNVLTGFGVEGMDKRGQTKFGQAPILTELQLQEMYRGDGFAKRVVELPTKEMMRKGFDLTGDPDRKVQAIFEERKVHKKVADMLRWSRLYGGAIGVMGLMDGGRLDQPVNEKAIIKLDFLHVFDRWRVNWSSTDLYSNPTDPKFGEAQFYHVSPITGNPFKVHETRVLLLDGMPIPPQGRLQNQGWGDSVIQSCFEQIRALAGTFGGMEIIIEDFIQSVLGVKNLSDMLATPEGSEQIKNRLHWMDISRHILNMLMIDSEFETYTKQASSVAGMPELLDRFAMALSGVTGIPQTLLFGRSPAGMNATGESDDDNWHDWVRSEQEDKLAPIYERLIHLTFLSKECGGVEPADWSIEFNPLKEHTEKEILEMRKLRAEITRQYYDMNVLMEDEIREQPEIVDNYDIDAGRVLPDPSAEEPPPVVIPPATTPAPVNAGT